MINFRDNPSYVTIRLSEGSLAVPEDSAARRFYERSHRIKTQRSDSGSPAISELQQIMAPGHRSNCVYRELLGDTTRNICELGYGKPQLLPTISRLSKSYTIVDIVDRSLNLEVPLPENTHFVESDLNNAFPFEDGSFDTVIAMMVVEHLFDPFHSFAELARICRIKASFVSICQTLPRSNAVCLLLMGRMPMTSNLL